MVDRPIYKHFISSTIFSLRKSQAVGVIGFRVQSQLYTFHRVAGRGERKGCVKRGLRRDRQATNVAQMKNDSVNEKPNIIQTSDLS